MVEYKLYHFDTKFLADSIRFIFLHAGVPFEDIRLTIQEWRHMKEKAPWEQLPMLELKDGRVLGQSGAIAEFLGKNFGLSGDDEWSAMKCQEISDTLRDIRQEWRKVFFQKNRDKNIVAKSKFLATLFRTFLPQFSEMQEKSGGRYLVCERITYADILFAQNFAFFEETLGAELLEEFPKLKELKNAILALPKIKEYLGEKKSKSDTVILNHLNILG